MESVENRVRVAMQLRSSTSYEYDTYSWAEWALRYLHGLDRSPESAIRAAESVSSVAEPWIREALESAARCACVSGDAVAAAVDSAAKKALIAEQASGVRCA